MLQSYVLNAVASRHDMGSLAKRYLDRDVTSFQSIAGKGAKQKRFDDIEVEIAGDYAAEDADITLQLHETLRPRLTEDKALNSVYSDIELPLVPVLAHMEYRGTLVDANLLATQSGELADRMKALEEQAWNSAGEEFNLGSPSSCRKSSTRSWACRF